MLKHVEVKMPSPVSPEEQIELLVHIFADKLLEDVFSKQEYESVNKKGLKKSKPLTAELKQDLYNKRVKIISHIIEESQTTDPGVLMVAILLLQRFKQNEPDIKIDPENIDHLTPIILMIAAKTHDDLSMVNKDFAIITKLPIEKVNKLEILFLEAIKHDVTTTSKDDVRQLMELMAQKRLEISKADSHRMHSSSEASSDSNQRPRPRSRSL